MYDICEQYIKLYKKVTQSENAHFWSLCPHGCHKLPYAQKPCRNEDIMKQQKLIIGTLLMAVLLFTNSVTILASTYVGCLDTVTNDKITGWAWDSADPSSYAVARIVVKNQATAEIVQDSTVIASNYRADLAASGKGNGSHAFELPLEKDKLTNGTYSIEAYIGDQSFTNTLQCNNGVVTQQQTAQNANITPANIRSLGVFKTTAYCSCSSCSGRWGSLTSTGTRAAINHTIAVDPRVIPYGTKLMINGVIYTAEDKGSGVKGRHIDIYQSSHSEARQYGRRNVEVFLVQ